VALVASAKPLYTAPAGPPPVVPAELFTTIAASSDTGRFGDLSGSGMFWFHASMVPSSVAKMKRAGPELPIAKPGVLVRIVTFATWPVGAPLLPSLVGSVGSGISTTRGVFGGNGEPVPSYRVVTPALLSETKNGESPGMKEMPHGLTRLASVCGAVTAGSVPLVTRLVWTYPAALA
jgi:hypothetical protein